jgi:tRNA(Glu) U13 pseudouridine synthase TruD
MKGLIVDIDESNIGDFTIYDVVMPTIGHETKLPNNEIGEIMKELLKKDGISWAMIAGQQDIQATSASGSYRRIL